MTEYYRRGPTTQGGLRDPPHAGRLPDGSREIYVLNGPPTSTERSWTPRRIREVWKYARTNKSFVFVDRTKTGDYILLQRPAQ